MEDNFVYNQMDSIKKLDTLILKSTSESLEQIPGAALTEIL